MRTLFRKLIGVLLILLGMLLGFVPFVPGIVLVLLGLQLLGLPLVNIERVKEFFKRRKSND